MACVLLLAWTNPRAVSAQDDTGDSLRQPYSPVRVNMGFERNVNTFLWDFGGAVRYGDGPWSVQADERFLRTLIRTDRNNVKDEQNLRLGISRSLASNLDLTTSFRSFIFSDQRSLGLNDVITNKPLAGLRWRLDDWLTVSPMAGYSFDQQQGTLDQGFMYSASAQLRDLLSGRYVLSADLFSTTEYISPRQQQEHRAAGVLVADFSQSARNQTQLSYRRITRDFYLPYDSLLQDALGVPNQIERRDERSLGVMNSLQYDVSDALRTVLSVELGQRDIARTQRYRVPDDPSPVFDTDVLEFRLNGSFAMQYDDGNGTSASARAELSERTEEHAIRSIPGGPEIDYLIQKDLTEQKNNTIDQALLSINISHAVTPSDTLSVNFSTVKMQYDTPSPENFDDRDDLFLLAGLRWSHRFSRAFSASLLGDATLRHLVYIYAERSANNTWNRVFRLKPETEYRHGKDFVTRNAAEVVGNYTVYDFEMAGQPTQSYSMRQLTLSDSTMLRVVGDIWADLRLHLRVYERGELYWSDFEVRPLNYFDERTISLAMMVRAEKIEASVGYRLFQQTRYRYHLGEREKDAFLRSHGPTCRLRMDLANRSYVLADGWYQLTTGEQSEARVTPNLLLSLVWNL
jgi:hypothetical protein